MSLWMRMIRWCLCLFVIAGCSAGAESGPVSLPVPFAGDLVLAKHVIASGSPTAECILRGHRSGNEWDILDDTGQLIGRMFFDCESADNFTHDGRQDGYTLDVVIELVDGSMLRVANMQFFEVPYPFPLDPGFDLSQAIKPGETGAAIVSKKGLASGLIIAGATGRFAGTVGKTLDLRYLFHEVKHDDGTFTFFGIDFGSTLIHFDDECIFLDVGQGIFIEDVLVVLFENETRETFEPDENGFFTTPLFCEECEENPFGDSVCGNVRFSIENMTDIGQGNFETISNGTYCVCDDSKSPCTDCDCANDSCATFSTIRSVDSIITGIEIPDFPNGTVLQSMIAEHGPAENCTGRFADACREGKLDLDFRCLTVMDIDPDTGAIGRIRLLGGANILSRMP